MATTTTEWEQAAVWPPEGYNAGPALIFEGKVKAVNPHIVKKASPQSAYLKSKSTSDVSKKYTAVTFVPSTVTFNGAGSVQDLGPWASLPGGTGVQVWADPLIYSSRIKVGQVLSVKTKGKNPFADTIDVLSEPVEEENNATVGHVDPLRSRTVITHNAAAPAPLPHYTPVNVGDHTGNDFTANIFANKNKPEAAAAPKADGECCDDDEWD